MPDKIIESVYEESWKMYLEQGKGLPENMNTDFGSAIAEIVGSGRKVLDIGCGTGKCLFPLQEKGNEVVGADISQEALRLLRKRGLKTLQFDIEHDDIAPLGALGPFDAIIMTDVLEHLLDPLMVLREKILPLLKADGRCIVTVPNFVYLTYRLEAISGKISHFGNNNDETGHAIPRPYNLGHKTLFNKGNLVRTFELAGFSKIHIEPELFSESFKSFWRIGLLRNLRRMVKSLWPTLLAARFLVVAEK